MKIPKVYVGIVPVGPFWSTETVAHSPIPFTSARDGSNETTGHEKFNLAALAPSTAPADPFSTPIYVGGIGSSGSVLIKNHTDDTTEQQGWTSSNSPSHTPPPSFSPFLENKQQIILHNNNEIKQRAVYLIIYL